MARQETMKFEIDRHLLTEGLKRNELKPSSKETSKIFAVELGVDQKTSGFRGPIDFGTWIFLENQAGKTKLELRKYLHSKQPRVKEYLVNIDSFKDMAAIIKRLLSDQEYHYIEIENERYRLGNVDILVVERPRLPCEVVLNGTDKAELKDCAKKLGLKLEIPEMLDLPFKSYYRVRGVDYSMVHRIYKKKLDEIIKS